MNKIKEILASTKSFTLTLKIGVKGDQDSLPDENQIKAFIATLITHYGKDAHEDWKINLVDFLDTRMVYNGIITALVAIDPDCIKRKSGPPPLPQSK